MLMMRLLHIKGVDHSYVFIMIGGAFEFDDEFDDEFDSQMIILYRMHITGTCMRTRSMIGTLNLNLNLYSKSA